MDDLQPFSVGALLKSRRNELGLSLAEVAARTNIRRAYLEALETDRYDVLPGVAYQSGFLRNYAEVLGLEPASVLQQWRGATGKSSDGRRGQLQVAPAVMGGSSPARRQRRRVMLIPVLLLAAAIGLYLSGRSWYEDGMQLFAPSLPAVAQNTQSPPESVLLPPAPGNAEGGAISESQDVPAAITPAPFPPVPAEGAVIRLEATGPLAVAVAVDSRPLQSYDLRAASSLQWNVARSARVTLDNPAAVKIWLGSEQLDLAGRTEIVLGAASLE